MRLSQTEKKKKKKVRKSFRQIDLEILGLPQNMNPISLAF